MKEIKKQLKKNGVYKDENGIWKLLPRRKGKVYGSGPSNKKALYSKRIRFIPSKKIKDELCK